MSTITRWDQSRGLTSLQDQVNRLFEDSITRDRSGHADLPDLQDKDIDVRVENNMLTIRGERKFDKDVNEDNYLRVECSYGSFTRSFSLPLESLE
jgi:HSP20 family protein